MADLSGWPTDGEDGSVATEARWRKMAKLWAPSGVVAHLGSELTPTAVAGPAIQVASGAAWVDGHYTENETTQTIAASADGLLVVRFTPAENLFELVWRAGVTAPEQSDAVWELPIASMTAGVMSDKRRFTGAMASAMEIVQDTTLAAAAATIDFPAIPAVYSQLKIVAVLRSTDGATLFRQLNVSVNGLATGYDSIAGYVQGQGPPTLGSVEQINAASWVMAHIASGGLGAGIFAPVELMLPNYAAATIRPSCLSLFGSQIAGAAAGAFREGTGFGLLRSAVVVNRVTLAPQTGNFEVGSRATLYGLR